MSRRAQVGVATVYRRFPNKEALLTEAFTEERDRTLQLLLDLLRRAQEAGALRRDFVLEDVGLALMANAGIRAQSPEVRAEASRRFAA
ncbi:TetR family transcriptional regulator [Streptomyces smyrnaeus]|uniref:SbtR family transcriptional regulator n=1 Tax=Streptomyces smyrnaeus TaxID=1387713 RepID=UPI0033D146D7